MVCLPETEAFIASSGLFDPKTAMLATCRGLVGGGGGGILQIDFAFLAITSRAELQMNHKLVQSRATILGFNFLKLVEYNLFTTRHEKGAPKTTAPARVVFALK
jgi:hypothetical protein